MEQQFRGCLPLVTLRLLPLICLVLGACGGPGAVGSAAAVECAPFARALTGVPLSGAAADWWRQAEGRLRRARKPEVGSILVFRRSSRLPDGHVAVVSQVVSARRIRVMQANWVHHRVTEDQPVIDVSAQGDWSEVRVWWAPSGEMGKTDYSTFGFIRPDRPIGRDRLVALTPWAIRTAASGR
ncbi:CHAP domain-containing protein [Rhodopila sp.]|uniref:CHAP domain-containing protein n=1 Tax=Rhodopila sp. TaxID=2480087 RepID=UPI003D0CBF96